MTKTNTTMEKIDEARKLLESKVRNAGFEDDVYTLVFDKVSAFIGEVEKELGTIDDDDSDGTCWYDDVREDMMSVLYKRIGEWLTKQ